MSLVSVIAILLAGFLVDIVYTDMALEMAIHRMIYEVTQRYFKEYPCIVLVSEKLEPLSDVHIDKLPVMRLIVGEKSRDSLYIDDNNTTDTYALGKGAQEFECLLEKSLDARCIGYIIQITNPKSIVHSFSRTVARTVQRVPRSYVFLPSMKTKDMDKFAEEVLSLKDLDLMPNILIAKMHTNIPVRVSLEEALSLRNLYCADRSLQLQGQEPYRTQDTLRQGRNFVENLSLKFKQRNITHIIYPSHPKLSVNKFDNNSMVSAIEIVTQSYVGLNPSEEVFLDLWMQFGSEGFFALCANLYPNKILDLQGKPLTAIAIPYDPFVIMYHYNDPPIYDGIEFLIFRELVKKFNGTMKVIYDAANFWGAIFENGTGNGIVGAVLTGQADAGFAAMYLEWYYEWLWTDFTYPYVQSAAILVVPRPKLLAGYFVPLLPFSPNMWAAVLVSILVISVCTWCLSAALHLLLPGFKKERMSLGRGFLDTLAMLVLQVPNEGNEEARYSPWKHFMTWLFIYFLLITSVYSGGLASILTVPRYERPLDTLVELAKSDINWTFTHEAPTWAFRYSDDPVLRTIADKFMRKSNEEIAATALKGDTGVHIEKLAGGAFCYGPYITLAAMSKLRLMREPFYWAHVVLIARKGGPYMQPLNDLILAMNQGGLGIYWEADVVRRFLSSRLQLLIAVSRTELDPDGDTLRTLQLTHVEGPFILLAMGLGTSFFIFLAELITYRCKKKLPPC